MPYRIPIGPYHSDAQVILAALSDMRGVLERAVVPVFTTDRTVRARAAGVGGLSQADALAYGVVGPVARASGLASDVRQDQPYAAYGELDFKMVTAEGGDANARVVVRALEMLESMRLIEAALRKLPGGLLRTRDRFPVIGPGEATARSEAPRGELFYYLAADGGDHPQRLRIRTPSLVNIPAIAVMAAGQTVADLPIIQASVDPCCSCTDR